jgi:hypothetical protein
LFFYLHEKGVEVMVAPYEGAAQLTYMLKGQMVKSIVGSASCLVFGAERVIVDFNWTKGTFSWISREQILRKFGINPDQFVDICLLAGCSILPAFQEVAGEGANKRVGATRTLLASFGRDGHALCVSAGDNHYLGLFRKAKVASKHMVVIHAGGEIKQMNFDSCPSDSHEFVGQRIPDEIFNYTSRGLLGFRVLDWRTRSEIFETPPLDGGESAAYKDLVQKKLTPLRARALALMTKTLHRYWQKKDVELMTWFREDEKQQLGIPELTEASLRDAETWHVKTDLLDEATAVEGADVTKTPLQFTIGVLSDASLAKKTVTPRKDTEHSLLTKSTELLSNTVWRFLQDRGYINNDHTLSAWGKALRTSLERASNDNLLGTTNPANEGEEAILVAFELLRLDVLNNRAIFPNPPYSESISKGGDSVRANINLISRVASLASFRSEAVGYTGPLSRMSLGFHQMAATVRHSLRDLIEMHACYLMTSGSVVRVRDYVEYTNLGAQLPFRNEPDAGLAIIVKTHLEEQLNSGDKADISKWFGIAVDVEGDLAKAWKIWDAVCIITFSFFAFGRSGFFPPSQRHVFTNSNGFFQIQINEGVQAADSGIINSDTKNMFHSADSWLKDKRQLYRPSSNGVDGGV